MRSDRLKFELPDDLAELGSQLTDDANHLAARYPAVANTTEGNLAQTFLWPRIAVAAVLLAVCGTAAAGVAPFVAVNHSNCRSTPLESAVLAIRSPAENPAPPANPAGVQEVGFNLVPSAEGKLDESQMLRIQLNAFEQVIQRLQHQLELRERSEADTQKLVESLRHEVQDLNRRLDERDKSQSR